MTPPVKPMAQNLLSLLQTSFSDSDLQNICYELRINYEDLRTPGLAGRTDKMRALVLLCQENGRLPDLITICRQLRPRQEWPDPVALGSEAELFGQPLRLLHFEPETVAIPRGHFLMGRDAGDVPAAEKPQHTLELGYFRSGKYPITNSQYAEFLRQRPQQSPPPPNTGWFGKEPPAARLDHPVVGVSWEDARAYCRWLSDVTGRAYRLPGEAEWEKAARGTDGRLYPWGNEWQEGLCNVGSGGTTAVTAYDATPTPYGCVDMLGNVAEWTSAIWGENRQEPAFPYPYQPNDGREDPNANQQNPRLRRVCRGGAFDSDPAHVRCTARDHLRANSARLNLGFRIVL